MVEVKHPLWKIPRLDPYASIVIHRDAIELSLDVQGNERRALRGIWSRWWYGGGAGIGYVMYSGWHDLFAIAAAVFV
jgi:hypothetical protein